MTTGFMRRTFKLEFEDPSFGGLEVRTRTKPLRFLVELEQLMSTNLADDVNAADLERFHEMLAEVIISWNLLDDAEQPVPITGEAIGGEEWLLLKEIARAWVQAVTAPPRPLSQPSSGGDPLAGLDIPMEALSPSQQSSPPLSE
jgi:hypothetical protein